MYIYAPLTIYIIWSHIWIFCSSTEYPFLSSDETFIEAHQADELVKQGYVKEEQRKNESPWNNLETRYTNNRINSIK